MEVVKVGRWLATIVAVVLTKWVFLEISIFVRYSCTCKADGLAGISFCRLLLIKLETMLTETFYVT